MKPIFLLFMILLVFEANAQISDFKTIDFSKADLNAQLNKGTGLESLPILAYKLTHNLSTEVEKFRAIYTWVCKNIKGDANQDRTISKKRKFYKNDSLGYLKWNNEYQKTAFKKLRKNKKTMCTGYAYLVKKLCSFVNIECEIINGFGRTIVSNVDKLESGNHSWNAVKLNGKWYLCDPTWSSGYFVTKNVFRSDYNDGYFLADPVLFARNHHPFEKKWLLDSTLINKSFTIAPLIYSEAFKHQLIPVTPKTMKVVIKKGTELKFSFKSLNDNEVANIALVQLDGARESWFKIYDLQKEGSLTSFKRRFKYKGSYDVHLKANHDIIASYVIDVE